MPDYSAPNAYVLTGHSTHLSYTTTGVDGQPTLAYQNGSISSTFTGQQIRTVIDETSDLVSVSIHIGVDNGYTSFTLFVPRVNLADGSAAHITTVGIIGVHRLTLDTPSRGTAGQLPRPATVRNGQSYRIHPSQLRPPPRPSSRVHTARPRRADGFPAPVT